MLPVERYAPEIEAALRTNQVVIVCGETGSGKTTQIPKLCLAAGFAGKRGRIACTQPRRIAAVSVAERVAAELGCECGSTVGWQHRFSSRLSGETRIKFMTDGILLSELRSDPLLAAYRVVMVDEAHERSLNVDFLLGCLKRIIPRRPDLKVVVSSATMQTDAFSRFFGGAPVVSVPGRTYPVEVRWRPQEGDDPDLAAAVADAVRECAGGPFPGDVLVFLPGERDIRAAADAVSAMDLPRVDVLALHSSLPPDAQRRAFTPSPGRTRVVLSTNVAETSVTIPGVRYVVDSGLARIARYSPRAGVKRLHVEKISRASAEQRKGRCGRIGPGVCIRLYDAEDYEGRPAQTEPEILRASLAGTVLSMMDWGLGDIERFPFLQPPPASAVREGRRQLVALGAIREPGRDGPLQAWSLTALGRRMAKLPLEPAHSRMLFEAEREGAMRDALTVVSALACEDPLLRPQDKADAAKEAHARFRDKASDFDGILLLWRAFHDEAHPLSRSAMRRECIRSFVSWRRMCEWEDVRAEIERFFRRRAVDVSSCSGGHDGLHKALLSGLLHNIGVWDDEEKNYKGANGARMSIVPGSALARAKPPPRWMVCAERIDTSRLWARRVAGIDPAWILPLARAVCSHSYTAETWDERSGVARALRRTVLYGLVVEDGVRCDISAARPELARALFIRHGLVEGRLPKPWPRVVARNREVVAARTDAASKDRSLSPESEIDAFCALWDERIPRECVNWRSFREWLSRLAREEADALVFSGPEFAPPASDSGGFPPFLEFSLSQGRARVRMPVSYKHDDKAPDDGISCLIDPEDIPLALLFDSSRLVPGALAALVARLLRELPKATLSLLAARAGLDPRRCSVEDISRVVVAALPSEGSLLRVLPETLQFSFSVPVPRNAWDADSVALAWRWRWVVSAGRGEAAFETRSSAELREFALEYGRIRGAPLATAYERVFGGDCRARDAAKFLERVRIGTAGKSAISAWTAPQMPPPGSGAAVRPALFPTEAAARAALESAAAEAGARFAANDMRESRTRSPFSQDAEKRAAVEVFGGNPPLSMNDFAPELRRRGASFRALARNIATLAEAVDDMARECLEKLERPALRRETATDAAEQLGWLCPPGFAATTPSVRLAEFPRYLEALSRRLDAAVADPDSEMRKLRSLRGFWTRFADLANSRDCAPPFDEKAFERYRWLVEEFRVAVFAQALGTAEKVSAPRLEALWSQIVNPPPRNTV